MAKPQSYWKIEGFYLVYSSTPSTAWRYYYSYKQITFLELSEHLREYYHFTSRVPEPAPFSRFKDKIESEGLI